MAWFDRFRRKRVAEHERVSREVGEMLDPYTERTHVVEGDRAMVNPGQILENIRARMGRIDIDPDTEWSPENVMSLEEGQVLFQQLRMGRMVVTETAWYARQILARWPAENVEHPMPPEARIESFLDGPTVDAADGDIARKVINRALASHEHIETHPELGGLDPVKLLSVWIGVVSWFGIKSGYLNKQDRGELPPRPRR